MKISKNLDFSDAESIGDFFCRRIDNYGGAVKINECSNKFGILFDSNNEIDTLINILTMVKMGEPVILDNKMISYKVLEYDNKGENR